jgi:acyl carrier protein
MAVPVIRVLVVTVNRPKAGRDALAVAAAAASLPADPAGYRFPHPRASVTHTGRAGAAAVLVGGPATGVGVDLEHDRPMPRATARFYLRDDEPRDDLLRLWTVKEAMFKADPDNATRMLRDYRADDPAYQHVSARHLGGWLTVAVRLSREHMTTPTITFETVAGRISEVLRVPAGGLTPQTLIKDLAADSFMLVEMVVDLQEEFDAVFSQAQLREIDSLSQLVELLQDSTP